MTQSNYLGMGDGHCNKKQTAAFAPQDSSMIAKENMGHNRLVVDEDVTTPCFQNLANSKQNSMTFAMFKLTSCSNETSARNA